MNRYKHQIASPLLGEKGQTDLSNADVAIVGCGGLGSNVAMILARMGIGKLRIFDDDVVHWSNLHRQAFSEYDVEHDRPKVVAMAYQIRAINSEITVDGLVVRIDRDNISVLTKGVNLVVDATNNLETRLVINDHCFGIGTPWIYGGVEGVQGMSLILKPGRMPCFRCIFPSGELLISQSESESAGVLPPIVNIIASQQAMQAVKVLTGSFDSTFGKLIIHNGWTGRSRQINVDNAYRTDCSFCGESHNDC